MLQGSLANFAASVLLILFRAIRVGDFVEVAGVAGSVLSISIFSTTLLTGDNKTVIVANEDVFGGNITNYNRRHKPCKFSGRCGLGFKCSASKR